MRGRTGCSRPGLRGLSCWVSGPTSLLERRAPQACCGPSASAPPHPPPAPGGDKGQEAKACPDSQARTPGWLSHSKSNLATLENDDTGKSSPCKHPFSLTDD